MKTFFFKYQGAGNDFILLDGRQGQYDQLTPQVVSKLCDRKFGIGADGVILIKKSEEADLWIDFMNPDGSRSFCGNGSRCGLLFGKKLGMIPGDSCTFQAVDGIHSGVIVPGGARISMKEVRNIEVHELGHFLDTGSPHLIIPMDDLEELNVREEGSKIRYNHRYSELGVNVNFVREIGPSAIAIRTYERGVEDETLACGTGVTAAALVYAREHDMSHGCITVKALGGDLEVVFVKEGEGFNEVYLEGPAEEVFCGEIAL